MAKYFEFDYYESISDLQKEYKKLSKENHPYLGGDTEIMKEINIEFETIIDRTMNIKSEKVVQDRGFDFDINATPFSNILKKVMLWNIDIEVIGIWIYAFNSFELKNELKDLGFWFSKKHKAWVFSGTKKKNIRSKYTINDVRSMHGSSVLKEKTEKDKVTA